MALTGNDVQLIQGMVNGLETRLGRKIEGVDARLDGVDARLDRMDAKIEESARQVVSDVTEVVRDSMTVIGAEFEKDRKRLAALERARP